MKQQFRWVSCFPRTKEGSFSPLVNLCQDWIFGDKDWSCHIKCFWETVREWLWKNWNSKRIVNSLRTTLMLTQLNAGSMEIFTWCHRSKWVLEQSSQRSHFKLIINNKAWLDIMKVQSPSNTMSTEKQAPTNLWQNLYKSKSTTFSLQIALCIEIHISVGINLHIYVCYWTAFIGFWCFHQLHKKKRQGH